MAKRAIWGLVLAGLALVSGGAPALAQAVRLLGDFSAWSAYAGHDGRGPVCFALSRPTNVAPRPEGYGQAYLYVTHRPVDGVRNEINVVAGVELAPGAPVTVTVGGARFAFFSAGDAAWLESPAQSENLAGAIRAGSTLSVEATSASGARFTQTYSLAGATASSQAIGSECA